jgi:hypothetical protein
LKQLYQYTRQHGITTYKTVIYTVSTVKTSNLTYSLQVVGTQVRMQALSTLFMQATYSVHLVFLDLLDVIMFFYRINYESCHCSILSSLSPKAVRPFLASPLSKQLELFVIAFPVYHKQQHCYTSLIIAGESARYRRPRCS